jgi:vacuolar-type H+-ATPase subunit E/Vma4
MGSGAGLREAGVEPASAALLADARDRAATLLREAEEQDNELIEDARRNAEDLLARAREEGAAAGRAHAARDAGLDRAAARWQVLAAQRISYEELLRGVRSEVIALQGEQAYPELLQRLAAAARRDLGEDAELEIDPPGLGGVRARAGSRRVDYTLPSLADRCVQDLGPLLARLWA